MKVRIWTAWSGMAALVGSALAATPAITGCSGAPTDAAAGSGEALRDVSRQEAVDDFDEIAASFRSMYGALAEKQTRYNFNFEKLVTSFRSKVSASKDDAEVAALFQEFISTFRDPHVSLSTELYADSAKAQSIPLLIAPFEQTYLVYAVGQSIASQVHRGDELVSVDGMTPTAFVAGMSKYAGVANPLTAKHFVSLYVTQRPYWVPAAYAPRTANAALVLKNAAGQQYTVTVPWKVADRLLPPKTSAPSAGESAGAQVGHDRVMMRSDSTLPVLNAELTAFGARVPFYMTASAQQSLGVTGEVKPSAAALAKYSLAASDAAVVNYYATTYSYQGKNVLLVRLPDYEPLDANGNDNSANALSYLRAVLDEQSSKSDVLVLDETHNPGGSLDFAQAVFSMLVTKTSNGLVQKMHGDRQWIQTYAGAASQLSSDGNPADAPFASVFSGYAHAVDDAYSAKQPLSTPIPFFNAVPTVDPDPVFHWTKPFVMLTDELSVSCADFVPAVVKANGAGVLFGQTTMGGGGNVEQVATLTNTQGSLSISRGMGSPYDPTGAYPASALIEDNGVTPDILYNHTVADFRAGYLAYVAAFSAVAAGQAPAAPPADPTSGDAGVPATDGGSSGSDAGTETNTGGGAGDAG